MKKISKLSSLLFLTLIAGLSCPDSLAGAGLPADDSVKVVLTEGTNMAMALSPDKKLIALDVQGTIYLIPAGGGKARPLTNALGDCRQPVWTPDGSKITFFAFWDGNYHIYSVSKDGGIPEQLTFGVSDNREPFWSPDGKKLLFSSDRSGNYDIWELEIGTGKLSQVTTDPGNDYFPAYSPDASLVSYVSERTSAPGIYIRSLSGEERVFVTTKGKLGAPVWHPTQKKIIFNQFAEGKSTLDMAAVGGGEWVTLSEEGEDVFPFKVSWMSDNELIYTSDGKILKKKLSAKGAQAIPFRVEVTLGKRTYRRKKYDPQATSGKTVKGIRGPVVSPGGKEIVFTALGDLYLLKEGSEVPVQLTGDEFVDIDAAWSRDGKKIVFASDRKGNLDLYIREMATGKETLVLDAKDAVTLPSWSADGKKIAFYEKDPVAFGRTALKYLDLGTGAVTTLYQPVFEGSQPSWSPDGRYVVISSLVPYSSRYREGVNKFLVIAVEDKSFRYVTPVNDRALSSRGKNGPYWSPDGTRLAFTMDGTLWTVPVGPEGDILAAPKRMTNGLAEGLSWTADSKSIVFQSIDKLEKVSLETGVITTIPLKITYKDKKPAEKYVIHAGKLFDGANDGYKTNVDVLIEGSRIVKIEPHQPGRPGKVMDASDRTLVPGLIEMHTHIAASAGEPQGRLWLSYGITTTREPGGEAFDVIERKESWASGRRIGPRVFFTGGILDGSRIYYGMNVPNLAGANLELELEKVRRLDFDFIKTYVRMPDALQRRITDFAHSIGIPVSSHEVFPAVSYGVDAVEHMGATSRRGYSPKLTALNHTYQDITELLIKSGMNITPTASLHGGMPMQVKNDPDFFAHSQFAAFFPAGTIDQVKAQTEMRAKLNPAFLASYRNVQKTLKTLVDGGARVTPGTDSPIIQPGISYHAELQTWVDAGLTPFQTIRAATRYSAEELGLGADLGTLEAGKLADMLIIKGDPLKNIKDLLNVDTVIRNGEVFKAEDLMRKRTAAAD